MRSALKALLSSKKVWTLLAGAAVWAGARWGFSVSPDALDAWREAVMVLIGAQGAQDLGKALASKSVYAATMTVSDAAVAQDVAK